MQTTIDFSMSVSCEENLPDHRLSQTGMMWLASTTSCSPSTWLCADKIMFLPNLHPNKCSSISASSFTSPLLPLSARGVPATTLLHGARLLVRDCDSVVVMWCRFKLRLNCEGWMIIVPGLKLSLACPVYSNILISLTMPQFQFLLG